MKRLAARINRLLTGSFGEKFIVIALLGLPIDMSVRIWALWRQGPLTAIVLTGVRSLIDSFVLTVVWHIVDAQRKKQRG
jgi:hypothetical protein